jgi:hypothetical protein
VLAAPVAVVIPFNVSEVYLRHAFVRYTISGESCGNDLFPAGVHCRVWIAADTCPALPANYTSIVDGFSTNQSPAVQSRYRVLGVDRLTSTSINNGTAFALNTTGSEIRAHIPQPGLHLPMTLFLVVVSSEPITFNYSWRLQFEQ